MKKDYSGTQQLVEINTCRTKSAHKRSRKIHTLHWRIPVIRLVNDRKKNTNNQPGARLQLTSNNKASFHCTHQYLLCTLRRHRLFSSPDRRCICILWNRMWVYSFRVHTAHLRTIGSQRCASYNECLANQTSRNNYRNNETVNHRSLASIKSEPIASWSIHA